MHAILQLCKLVQALQGEQREANLAKSAARTSLFEMLAQPLLKST